jgi:hypothetical protein
MQKMLTERELAGMLALTVGAIRKWRTVGYGPPAIKIGEGRRGAVRYRYEDVMAFIESRLRAQKKPQPPPLPPGTGPR